MADVQVLAPGTKAAPLAYTVPGAQEIIIKAMFATFDGTTAGGAFLPCIRIVAPGGKVVGEYVADSSVAAGSSAEVSFAPFLRNAPASAATAQPFAVTYRTGMSIPGTDSHLAPWDEIRSTGSEIDLDGSGRPQINEQGLYLIMGTMQIYDTTWAAPVWMTFDLTMVTGGAGNSLQNPGPGEIVSYPGWNDPSGDYNTQLNLIAYANVTTPPEQYNWRILFVTGSGGHNATGTYATATIQRLGDHSPAGV